MISLNAEPAEVQANAYHRQETVWREQGVGVLIADVHRCQCFFFFVRRFASKQSAAAIVQLTSIAFQQQAKRCSNKQGRSRQQSEATPMNNLKNNFGARRLLLSPTPIGRSWKYDDLHHHTCPILLRRRLHEVPAPRFNTMRTVQGRIYFK